MTGVTSAGRVGSFLEAQASLLGDQADLWERDAAEARSPERCEVIIQSLLALLAGIERHDRVLFARSLAAGGSESAAPLYRAWLPPARVAERIAAGYESQGVAVEGAAELRAGLAEVAALLAPSDELGGEMAALRDRALRDDDAGLTLGGFTDD